MRRYVWKSLVEYPPVTGRPCAHSSAKISQIHCREGDVGVLGKPHLYPVMGSAAINKRLSVIGRSYGIH